MLPESKGLVKGAWYNSGRKFLSKHCHKQMLIYLRLPEHVPQNDPSDDLSAHERRAVRYILEFDRFLPQLHTIAPGAQVIDLL